MWKSTACMLGSFGIAIASPMPIRAQSLAQAVTMAVDNSARLSRADAGLALAYEERTGTAAQGRMRVQVDGSVTRRREETEQRNFAGTTVANGLYVPRNTLGVTVSQPIYTGGRLREALGAAEARIESAQFRTAAAEIQAGRNAAASYAEVIRAQIVADVSSSSVTSLLEDVRGAKARYEAGEVSVTDIAQSEARLAAAQSQLARANGDLESARAIFTRFVGQSPRNLDTNFPYVALPATMVAFLDVVSTENLDILASRTDYEAANSATRLAATQRNPRVTLEASYEQRWNEAFVGSNSSVGQVGARVTVPLWDGGQTSSNVRQAAARATSARYQLQDLQEETRANAIRAWADYAASQMVVQAGERQVEAAELARRGAQAELRFGLRSTIEALNQEQELRAARVALATARRDAYVDLIDLLSLMGRNPLGQPARAFDPARRSAVPAPRTPPPLAIEAPLVTVLEFLEAVDKPVSEAFYQINQAIEPARMMGPIP
jgi:outer membrane protein